jgi:hypothetical protein
VDRLRREYRAAALTGDCPPLRGSCHRMYRYTLQRT